MFSRISVMFNMIFGYAFAPLAAISALTAR
jgi:hypothetical protein